MKFALVFILFGVTFARHLEPSVDVRHIVERRNVNYSNATDVPQSLDFDWQSVKNIWESPKLQTALHNIDPTSSNIDLTPRIVGGSYATTGQFPFHVLLVLSDSQGSFWCGGSLLNEYWVLTAAHCVDGMTGAQIYSITDVNEGYYWNSYAVLFASHGNYDSVAITYDIALIKTGTPASITPYTNYISLPRNNVGNNFAGYSATIQGFGRYSDTSGVSNELKYVTRPVLDNSKCALTWDVNAYQVCLNAEGGQGACNGDSGGGLNYGGQVIGIVSYGAAAGCQLGYPNVFTRVTSYLDWIDNVLNNY